MTLATNLVVRTAQVTGFFVNILKADIPGHAEEAEIEQVGDGDAEEVV